MQGRELENTYFINRTEPNNEQKEMLRLVTQDQLLTKALGETLPNGVHDVLDIGCGTGGWIITMAKQYPAMKFVGIDISSKVIEHAREQAKSEGLTERVRFFVMDALRLLEFEEESFDFVHMRMSMSFMRTWDWQKLLDEFQRVTKQGGIIRVIESDFIRTENKAFSQLVAWTIRAMHHAGYLFTESIDGLTSELPEVLARFGIKNIKTTECLLTYTHNDIAFYEDMRYFYRLIIPFLRRWIRLPENYDEIYTQAMEDMRQEGFLASWRFLIIEGTVSEPSRDQSS